MVVPVRQVAVGQHHSALAVDVPGASGAHPGDLPFRSSGAGKQLVDQAQDHLNDLVGGTAGVAARDLPGQDVRFPVQQTGSDLCAADI
jgi:hypothetical protein